MSSYQPQRVEAFLLTVVAVRITGDDRGALYGIETVGGPPLVIEPGDPSIVRVEPLPKPALPTAFGARIVATRMVGADVGKRTELVRVGDWWIAAADEGRYEDDELSDVEVLWPTAEDDPQSTGELAGPIPEPEPLELPTKFGAVVVAMYQGETGLAVRSDPSSPVPWFVTLPRCRNRWASDGELAVGAVLSPGIEVDLP